MHRPSVAAQASGSGDWRSRSPKSLFVCSEFEAETLRQTGGQTDYKRERAVIAVETGDGVQFPGFQPSVLLTWEQERRFGSQQGCLGGHHRWSLPLRMMAFLLRTHLQPLHSLSCVIQPGMMLWKVICKLAPMTLGFGKFWLVCLPAGG